MDLDDAQKETWAKLSVVVAPSIDLGRLRPLVYIGDMVREEEDVVNEEKEKVARSPSTPFARPPTTWQYASVSTRDLSWFRRYDAISSLSLSFSMSRFSSSSSSSSSERTKWRGPDVTDTSRKTILRCLPGTNNDASSGSEIRRLRSFAALHSPPKRFESQVGEFSWSLSVAQKARI